MRISDWSSDVCSSDLTLDISLTKIAGLWLTWAGIAIVYATFRFYWEDGFAFAMWCLQLAAPFVFVLSIPYVLWLDRRLVDPKDGAYRSEEHTSELQSLMRISYAVFCLKKKKQ